MNRFHARFILVLAATLVANLWFQKNVADFIFPDRECRSCDSEPVNDVPAFMSVYSDGGALERHLELPRHAVLERGNHGATREMSGLIDLDGRKLDVLFVGDSSVSWGFDFTQFARQSELRTASLSFGMNVPDNHLAALVRHLVECFMQEDGVVILSYSWRVLSAAIRLNRTQDRFIIDGARLTDCHRLVALFDSGKPIASASAFPEALWNRRAYGSILLSPLQTAAGRLIPLSSARIGVANMVERFQSPAAATSDPITFLRWHPSFRIPLVDNLKFFWRYREFDDDRALRDWDSFKKSNESLIIKRRSERLYTWRREFIGRKVCVASPITVMDESWRYGEWKEFGRSDCFLNYSEIFAETTGMTKIPMQDNHHFANFGGLIMADALGRYFKQNRVLDRLGRKQAGDDPAFFIRDGK